MNSKIEKILKIIPIISILILISSLVKNYIYYDYFGITINEFINLSEFTLLFISEIKLYLIFIVSLLIFLPFIFIKRFLQKEYGEKNFSFSLTKTFTILFILSFPLRIAFTVLDESDILIIIEKCEESLIFFFICVLLVIKKDIKFIGNLYLSICAISLLIFSVTKAYKDIEKIKRNQASHIIEFNYENKTIKSGKDYLYLGKTHEYIFIYTLKNKYTEVFKIQEVKNIKIKKL